MGYYTRYDFSNNSEEVINEIGEISGYSHDNGITEEIKWYEHQDHLKAISLKHPDQKIYLEGTGEEQGDVWKAVYLNGEESRVTAQISFEDFKF